MAFKTLEKAVAEFGDDATTEELESLPHDFGAWYWKVTVDGRTVGEIRSFRSDGDDFFETKDFAELLADRTREIAEHADRRGIASKARTNTARSLHRTGGWSIGQIAAAAGVARGTVQQWLAADV